MSGDKVTFSRNCGTVRVWVTSDGCAIYLAPRCLKAVAHSNCRSDDDDELARIDKTIQRGTTHVNKSCLLSAKIFVDETCEARPEVLASQTRDTVVVVVLLGQNCEEELSSDRKRRSNREVYCLQT